MSVVLELPAEIESRLRRKAAGSGVTVEGYIRSLVEDAIEETPEEEAERPWRGVLVLAHARQALVLDDTLAVPVPLPRRDAAPNMNWQQVRTEDE